jgi:hypothetical protein
MPKVVLLSLIFVCVLVIMAGCAGLSQNAETQKQPLTTVATAPITPVCGMELAPYGTAPNKTIDEKLRDALSGIAEVPNDPVYIESDDNPLYDMLVVRLKNNCDEILSGRVLVKVYSDPEMTNVIQTTYGYYSEIEPNETASVKIMIDTEKIGRYYYYKYWY